MKLRTRSASCQMSSYCCWVIGMTICLAPRGTCVEGVFRSRSTCRVFGRASIPASPSLERSRMTKMPPAGYPAFLQYLQSGRVRRFAAPPIYFGEIPAKGAVFSPTATDSRRQSAAQRSLRAGSGHPVAEAHSGLSGSCAGTSAVRRSTSHRPVHARSTAGPELSAAGDRWRPLSSPALRQAGLGAADVSIPAHDRASAARELAHLGPRKWLPSWPRPTNGVWLVLRRSAVASPVRERPLEYHRRHAWQPRPGVLG